MRTVQAKTIIELSLTLCSLSLPACGTIPDLEPYAQSTAMLERAASSSHDIVHRELASLQSYDPNDPEFSEFPQRFSNAWQPRLRAMGAMVSYSDSLAAIAQAAKDGKRSASTLADSLQAFVGTAGGPIGLAASPAGAKIFTALAAATIEIRAAHDLDKAINAADPIIQEVSDLLIADFDSLETLLSRDQLEATLEASIKRSYVTNFGADPKYRKELIKSQQNAIAAIRQAHLTEPLNPTDIKQAEERLSQINEWLSATNSWHDQQAKELRELHARFANQRLVISKVRDGITEWRTIHHNLANTMKINHQRPNFRLLYNTATEIQAIFNEGKQP